MRYTTPDFSRSTPSKESISPIMSEELSNFQHLHPQESQQTKPKQQPLSTSHPTNPNMNRPPSSRYGNPLTFNVAVMFLFYVLSVSLCLSSFSICICVIFNPVGTFRAVANYLFYALGFSVLLTFLFVALTGVCFDTQASPEEQEVQGIVDDTVSIEVPEAAISQDAIDPMPRQGTRHKVSSLQEIIDATPIQEADREVPALEGVGEATLTQEAHPEHAALLAHRAERERLSNTHRPPPIEAQAASLYSLNYIDIFIINPTTRDYPAPPCTSQQVPLEDDSKKRCIASENTVNGNLRSCDNLTASAEQMGDVGEKKENTSSQAKVACRKETTSQEKATPKPITARESKKIEKWISQTKFAKTHAATATAQAFRGALNVGDHADNEDKDLDRDTGEMMACSGPLSETLGVDRDSDFQKALRVYMGMGGKCGGRQKRWSCFTPSLTSSGESEFQGWVRKTFKLEKVGERRRARSA